MATYVMLTKLAEEATPTPHSFEELGQEVTTRLKSECPDARWISSHSVIGPYDYVDIFDAPDHDTAIKVSLIVRTYGHAMTEIWPATPWDRFRTIVRETIAAGAETEDEAA